MQTQGSNGPLARLVVAVSLVVGYVLIGMAFDAMLFSSQF